jgi:hypothetical protein
MSAGVLSSRESNVAQSLGNPASHGKPAVLSSRRQAGPATPATFRITLYQGIM